MFEAMNFMFGRKEKPEQEEEPRTDFTDAELLVEIEERTAEDKKTFELWRSEEHHGRITGDFEPSREARRVNKKVQAELTRLRVLARERGLLDEGRGEEKEELEEAA